MKSSRCVFCLGALLLSVITAIADPDLNLELSAEEADLSTRVHGFSMSHGPAVSSKDDFDYTVATYQIMFDHPGLFGYEVHDSLKMKGELSMGFATIEDDRLFGSVSLYGMFYPPWFQTDFFKPYIEGGIGIIYTDFQAQGQGTRWNFAPQAGIGVNIRTGNYWWFVSCRWHHLSNAGLDDENSGVDVILTTVGYWF